jgi:type III secretory pathway component EscU
VVCSVELGAFLALEYRRRDVEMLASRSQKMRKDERKRRKKREEGGEEVKWALRRRRLGRLGLVPRLPTEIKAKKHARSNVD